MKLLLKSIVITFCIFFCSCKESFLDVEDTSSIIRQDYVKDLSTLSEYLNGIYILLSSDYYYGYNIIYADLISDNVKPPLGSSLFTKQYTWDQYSNEVRATTPSNNPPNMNPIWTIGYKIIRSCNFVLQEVDKYKDENLETARDIKGQALTLRAMVFHDLLNIFSQPYKFTADASHLGIPYVTTTNYEEPITRPSVNEIYSHLIKDLLEAIESLPESGTIDKRFISINSARALLSRIYLFKEDYKNAIINACLIIEESPIMSIAEGYPSKLFTDKETEALFQLAPEANRYFTFYASFFYRNADFIATNDIVDLLMERPGDVRNSWIRDSDGKSIIEKFSMNASAAFQTVFRSSEQYLIAAESYARIGKEDSARFYLDKIRMRADEQIAPSQFEGKTLIDSIEKERRKEFCFEGLRMYDVLRLGKDVVRLDAMGTGVHKLAYPNSKAIAPIPMLDVLLKGLEQNPGY